MLFSKKTPEEKMEKLVHRKAWGELSEYMFKDKEHKIALAQALGTSETEEAIDLLMELVESKDQDILEAACESLKKVGDDHNATELLRILQTIPEEKERQECPRSWRTSAIRKRGNYYVNISDGN